MPAPRKSKLRSVSLAGGKQEEPAARQAKAMLRQLNRASGGVSEGATPERLARARGDARIERFDAAREQEQENDGRESATPRAAIGHRIRIDDSPLDRLRVRRLLASGANAEVRNLLLAEAGERYRRYWRGAGLDALRAIDISREQVSGGRSGLLRTERQLANFQAYGEATGILSEDARRVVEAIVLREREPLDIGQEISGYRQDKQATAVALYILRTALQELAVHFGLIRRGRDTIEQAPGAR